MSAMRWHNYRIPYILSKQLDTFMLPIYNLKKYISQHYKLPTNFFGDISDLLIPSINSCFCWCWGHQFPIQSNNVFTQQNITKVMKLNKFTLSKITNQFPLQLMSLPEWVNKFKSLLVEWLLVDSHLVEDSLGSRRCHHCITLHVLATNNTQTKEHLKILLTLSST